MANQLDNLYAAPRAPPEAKPPAPWPAYLRAALAGSTGFVVGFTLAAALATLIFAVVNGYGSAAEIWEGARYEILTYCFLIGALMADSAARREFRSERAFGSGRATNRQNPRLLIRLVASPSPGGHHRGHGEPHRDQWLHEIKLDGYRMACRVEGGRVKVVTAMVARGLVGSSGCPKTSDTARKKGIELHKTFILLLRTQDVYGNRWRILTITTPDKSIQAISIPRQPTTQPNPVCPIADRLTVCSSSCCRGCEFLGLL